LIPSGTTTLGIASPFMWLMFVLVISVFLAIDLFAASSNTAENTVQNLALPVQTSEAQLNQVAVQNLALPVQTSEAQLNQVAAQSRNVSVRKAAITSAIWIAMAGVFNLGIYVWYGADRAGEFAAGYLIEKTLAIDNIFLFVVIFKTFSIEPKHQHRVLMWGVFGALIMRAIFIFLGSILISQFHFTIYIFGFILVLTAAKLFKKSEGTDVKTSTLLRLVSRVFPLATTNNGGQFFVKIQNKWHITQLMLALICIEAADLLFAVDSIPAVFAVTSDVFVVFTSNIFAILGLRALYFVLADFITRFTFLKEGLAVVLLFVGAKMMLSGVFQVSIWLSLGVIAAVLIGAVLMSLLLPRKAAH
jgi:tellurite resistance protein TerC